MPCSPSMRAAPLSGPTSPRILTTDIPPEASWRSSSLVGPNPIRSIKSSAPSSSKNRRVALALSVAVLIRTMDEVPSSPATSWGK